MAITRRVQPTNPTLVKVAQTTGRLKSLVDQGAARFEDVDLVRLGEILKDGKTMGNLFREVLDDPRLQARISPDKE